MSTCAIITFVEGTPDDELEFRNAWGGAALIWTALFDKYLKNPNIPYDNWMSRVSNPDSNDLWDLSKRKDLAMCERAVHVSTFDRAYVCRENFSTFVKHLREFDALYPSSGNVSHLLGWASAIEGLERDVEAIGFHMTSVSEKWFRWNEEDEESIPYNLHEEFNKTEWRNGPPPVEVYELLEELDK